MKIVFFKFVGALRERRFDIAILALGHLVGSSLVNVAKLLLTPFSVENLFISACAFLLAVAIWIFRFMTDYPTISTPVIMPFTEIVVDIFRLTAIFYPVFLTVRIFNRWLQNGLQSAALRLETYEPRKQKEKLVYTSESLSRLLESNAEAFEVGDDGELVPIKRQH